MKYPMLILLVALFTLSLSAQERNSLPEPFTEASVQMHRDMLQRFERLQYRIEQAFARGDDQSIQATKPLILKLVDQWLAETARMRPILERRINEVDGRADAAEKKARLQQLASLDLQTNRLKQLRNGFAAWDYSTRPQHAARSKANLVYLREMAETCDKIVALEARVTGSMQGSARSESGARELRGQ